MLANLHNNKKLLKVKTSEIEVIPNMKAVIGLDQLNQLIAEQRGMSVNDLALGNQTSIQDVAKVNDLTVEEATIPERSFETKSNMEPLTDTDLAKKYRSDADRLSKEAAQLRRMAEELVPTKKKAAVDE
jgi:hypothetical protein